MIDVTRRFAAEHGIGPDRFEFQMLYGIRRDLQAALVRQGYRVRVYIPFGRQWFPYFMRRLGERPANVAFVAPQVLADRAYIARVRQSGSPVPPLPRRPAVFPQPSATVARPSSPSTITYESGRQLGTPLELSGTEARSGGRPGRQAVEPRSKQERSVEVMVKYATSGVRRRSDRNDTHRGRCLVDARMLTRTVSAAARTRQPAAVRARSDVPEVHVVRARVPRLGTGRDRRHVRSKSGRAHACAVAAAVGVRRIA